MPGATNLKEDDRVVKIVKAIYAGGGIVAAICAAPLVLGYAGVLHQKKATCYPGFENQLTSATYVAEKVVCDGRVVTGNGPGNAALFALKLVEMAAGRQMAQQVGEGMLIG